MSRLRLPLSRPIPEIIYYHFSSFETLEMGEREERTKAEGERRTEGGNNGGCKVTSCPEWEGETNEEKEERGGEIEIWRRMKKDRENRWRC